MKDLIGKLTELEATAPKAPAGKKMLTEDSTSPMIVEPKTRSLKDVFNELSENVAPGSKPLAVMDPQNKKAGVGVLSSPNPGVQNILKNLDPKDVQIVMTQQQPTQQPAQQQQQQQQQGQVTGTTGATQGGQGNAMSVSPGQQAVKEKDEGKPGKNFAKIAKSAAKRYGSKEAGERVAGAVRAKLAKQGKLEEAGVEEDKWSDEMEQWALNKGLKNTGKKNSFQRAADRDKDWALSHRKSDTVKEEQLDEKFASKQQAKLMYATAGGADTGVSKKVAKEFIKKSHGQKVGKLPKKVKEGDIAPTSGIDTKGAGLGAGRSQTTLEGAKPDFLDLDKDGNKKEPMKKAVADKKKQKVKESMNHRISAARLEGKSHGLRGHAHSGKRYEDLEELKAYHEGYKEGLDECYGQGVYEAAPATPPATVGGMADAEMEEGKLGKAALALGGAAALATGAGIGKNIYDYHKKDASGYSQSDVDKIMGTDSRRSAYDREQERRGNYRFEEDEMEEGNLFTGNLAKARAAGKKTADLDGDGDMEKVKETAFAFEAWDNQLNELLNEGLSVSVSKGQQNSPDSVTITAQDAEADQLLQLVKSAGLGLFGGDEGHEAHPSSAMSLQPAHGAADEVGAGGVDIDVVDDSDSMLSLMKKLGGVEQSGSEDYADEEGDEDCGCQEETNEATCNECGMHEGMHESGCSMGKGKEMVDEVESEDQMEFEVAEDNAPDSETAEHNADEEAEAEEDAALAKSDMQNKTTTVNEEDDEEEDVAESFSFESIYRKLDMIAEESTEKKDEKAEKAGKKVAKDIEYDEGHKGKDDDKAEKAGKKVTKDIEYDDKKDKKEKVDEWANQVGKGPGKGTDASFEQDIEFMTKVIAGGLNKPKSTGQTTIPVVASQLDRLHDNPSDWATLAGIKKA